MKFYYANGTCALGIHILLEEIGKPYDVQRIDFARQEQSGEAYRAVNPKGKIPALVRNDGGVITEFPAIATWLALTFPEKTLLPKDPNGVAKALEIIDYVVATIHMQGFTRYTRPGNFSPNEQDHPAVRQRGLEIFRSGLALLDKQISPNDFAIGGFSIADAALFYVEFWMAERLKENLPPRLAAHYRDLRSRPSVKRVLNVHGFPS